MQALARQSGFVLQVVAAGTVAELDAAFAALAQQKADAFIVATDYFFITRRGQIATLAARYALPGMLSDRDMVDAEGLMSYGPSVIDAYRQLGSYASRILKGERAGELPVIQPTKFELVVNLSTARAIGLTIPELFLARADEVIEEARTSDCAASWVHVSPLRVEYRRRPGLFERRGAQFEQKVDHIPVQYARRLIAVGRNKAFARHRPRVRWEKAAPFRKPPAAASKPR